jgi:hypothetical protein
VGHDRLALSRFMMMTGFIISFAVILANMAK